MRLCRSAAGTLNSGVRGREDLLGGWLSGLTRSQEQHEADELSGHASDSGAEPICNCRRGEKVRVCGTIRSLAIRPRGNTPTVEAELYDGSGHLVLIWLGRRRIPGIEVGRMLIAEGRLTCPDGSSVIYNPDYELLPGGHAE